MDPSRFGRALGQGTREMAKTLIRAADAATAPNPNAPRPAGPSPATPRPVAPRPVAPRPVAPSPNPARPSATKPPTLIGTAKTLHQAHITGSDTLTRMTSAGRAAGKTALAPVTRAAGVLWLEVTGVFFGVFALGMGYQAWLLRAHLITAGAFELRPWATLVVALFFAWFTLSSFLRARRRSRR